LLLYFEICTITLFPCFTFTPCFGSCSQITSSFSSIVSPSFFSYSISNPCSFSFSFASFIVSPVKFGITTSSAISCPSSFCTSKYGSTSPNTCDAIGAATPPPWCIFSLQILSLFYLCKYIKFIFILYISTDFI